MLDLGTVKPGSTIYIPSHYFDSNDPSASSTASGFAVADVRIYKNGSTTERASTSGFTLLDTDGIDFDAVTGLNALSVDLSDNTTAGFYTAGASYWVVYSSVTVDTATINHIAATFRIGYDAALLDTTIATLASQTSFTLTAGSGDNDAYNGWTAVIHDVASAVQVAAGVIGDYVGSTKTVTLNADPAIFTMAAGDNISLFPPVGVHAWNAVALATTNPLPNAAPDNAGGLPISDAGGLDLDAILVDTNSLNDTKIPDTISLANINAQVDTAFTDYDPPTRAELTTDINSVLAQLPSDAPIEGTADSGSTTTMVDAVRTEADTDYWAGSWILFTSGTISGQARLITAFTPASDTITFTPATTQAVGTNTYRIIPAAQIQEVLALTGHTAQTGDSYARLGAPSGASVSADIAENQTDLNTILADTNELQTDWVDGGRLDLIVDATLADTNELQTDWVDGGRLDLIVDATLADTNELQTDWVDGGRLDLIVDNILTDTAEIGAAGAGLTAILSQLPTDAPIEGTADSGSTTTMVDAARTEADTDYWAGSWILFTSGTISGQARLITAFTPASDTITFTPATTQAVGTNTYRIVPAAYIAETLVLTGHTVQTGDNYARLGAPSGASVSADIAENQTDLNTILADTNELQTDWVDGGRLDLIVDAILADTNELQTDDVPGLIAALNNISTAQVNAEVVDALATDTYGEPGQEAPGATVSLAAKINYLYKAWRNKKDNDGSTTQLYADDGSTVDQKQTTSEAAGTVTKAEWVTGP